MNPVVALMKEGCVFGARSQCRQTEVDVRNSYPTRDGLHRGHFWGGAAGIRPGWAGDAPRDSPKETQSEKRPLPQVFAPPQGDQRALPGIQV